MSRRTAATLAALVVAILAVGAGAVYAYDSSHSDRIAKGVRIGGVNVGGLSADAARARLRNQLEQPLREPVIVRAGSRSFHLTAREAHVQVDTNQLVDRAVDASRTGSFVSRAWRDLTGGTVSRSLTPQVVYSKAAVQRLVDRVRVAVARAPRNADVDITVANVEVQPSKPGRTIDTKSLRSRVEAALLDSNASHHLRAKLKRVQPEVTTHEVAARYPSIITIDRNTHRLRLFKHLHLAKTYPIAVGMAGLETPAGRYTIQDKQVNPSWHVPDSSWAGSLAGKVIPPGPDNPIKARWMGIYNGAGIHGTSDVNSIGTSASHGCIRMRIPDVEELYDRVSIGTPVYIV